MRKFLSVFVAALAAVTCAAPRADAVAILPYLNVQSFGAVGDGSHDDRAAIQNAITTAFNGGTNAQPAVVWFPRGIYFVSAPLTMARTSDGYFPVKLMGASQSASGGSVIKGTGDYDLLDITDTAFNIRGWEIDGLGFQGGHREIKLDHAAYGSVRNCHFQGGLTGTPVAAIDMQQCTSIRFVNDEAYTFVGQTVVNDYYGSINQFNGCQFGEQIGTAMTWQGTQQTVVSGCIFQEYTGYAINSTAGSYSVITGNNFDTGSNTNCIRLVQSAASDGGDVISGNVFTGRNTTGSTEAITLYGRKNVAITGNAFNWATSILVRLSGSDACDGSRIQGNTAQSFGSPANWGQVLTSGNTKAEFGTNTFNPPITTTAASFAMRIWDPMLFVNRAGAVAVTLPPTPYLNQKVRVKDISGAANVNNVTVSPAAGTIDGATSYVINSPYGELEAVYNGTEWSIE